MLKFLKKKQVKGKGDDNNLQTSPPPPPPPPHTHCSLLLITSNRKWGRDLTRTSYRIIINNCPFLFYLFKKGGVSRIFFALDHPRDTHGLKGKTKKYTQLEEGKIKRYTLKLYLYLYKSENGYMHYVSSCYCLICYDITISSTKSSTSMTSLTVHT